MYGEPLSRQADWYIKNDNDIISNFEKKIFVLSN